MWPSSSLRNPQAGAPRTRRTRGRRTELPSRLRFAPRLEALECRVLPSAELSFADPIDYAAGTGPRSVTTGDFRGIGVQDLAVANFGSNNVSIFLGDGHGAFQLAEAIQVGNQPYYVTTGHFHDPNI